MREDGTEFSYLDLGTNWVDRRRMVARKMEVNNNVYFSSWIFSEFSVDSQFRSIPESWISRLSCWFLHSPISQLRLTAHQGHSTFFKFKQSNGCSRLLRLCELEIHLVWREFVDAGDIERVDITFTLGCGISREKLEIIPSSFQTPSHLTLFIFHFLAIGHGGSTTTTISFDSAMILVS